jgi:hypothetical protein
MNRLLYILALITACGSLSARAEAPLGAHIRADAGYLACVLSKIPEESRKKTALLLWPTAVPVGSAGTCANASQRLAPNEISDLQKTLEFATLSCQSELPADPDSRADATYGLLGVLLINPKTPADTASWDDLMEGSQQCSQPRQRPVS